MMIDISMFTINIITTIFEVLIINMFFSDFLRNELSFKNKRISLITVLYGAILLLINLFSPHVCTTLMLDTILVLGYTFAFGKKVKLNIFAALITSSVTIAAEAFSYFLIIIFGLVPSEFALSYESQLILGAILGKLLMFMGLKGILLFRKRKHTFVPKGHLAAFMIVPLVSMFTVLFVVSATAYTLSPEMMSLALIIVVGHLYATFITFYLFDSILEKSEYEIKNSLLRKQLSLQAEHYKELEMTNKETKKLRHDIKNRLIGIREYIYLGEYDKAMEYIDSTFGLIKRPKNLIDTGNSSLDAILFYKRAMAEEKKIPVVYDIQIPAGLKIDGTDCCVLLGNALDNAIEANEKIEDITDRYIECLILYQKNSLLCKITNPTKEPVEIKNNKILTTKENKKDHGIGLGNIKMVVEKYNGTLNLSCTDNTFELNFMLFVSGDECENSVSK